MVDACYKHKRTAYVEVPYSFQCEHCGKNSGSMKAVISAEATDVTYVTDKLDEQRADKLCMEAQERLVRKIRNIHKGIVEKKIYPKEFHDKCPFCHHPQSWAVSGLKKEMFLWPISCLGACSVFGLLVLLAYFLEDPSKRAPLALGVEFFFGLGVILAVGSLVWNIVGILIKRVRSSSGGKNFPLIEWEVFRNMLDER